MKESNKAYYFAAVSVLLWSTVASAFKLALKELTHDQLLLISTFVSFISILISLTFNNKLQYLKQINLKDLLNFAIIGFINPFLYYLVLFKAYELLPAQEALSLNYTWVITIVIFSIIFLKQKTSYLMMIGLIVSFFGVIVIGTKGDILSLRFQNVLGTVLAFSSSFIWAAFWIANLKSKLDEQVKLILCFAFGFIYTLLLTLSNGSFFLINVNLYSISTSVYIGLFEMGITFILWMKALSISGNTAKVGSLVYLSPFISLIIINAILKENIAFSTFIGLIFIVGGILLPRLNLSTFSK